MSRVFSASPCSSSPVEWKGIVASVPTPSDILSSSALFSMAPAMAAVWSLVKPSVFVTYLGLGVSGAIASGILFSFVV